MMMKTLDPIQEVGVSGASWTYDAAEADAISLVPDGLTCSLSFHDQAVFNYELIFCIVASTDTASECAADRALAEFSRGSDGSPPGRPIVSLAGRLSQAVIDHTTDPEITVDVDGALAFDLRLRNGLVMFAELQPDGSLSVTTLDDRAEEISVVDHLPSATEQQFRDLL